MSALNCRLLKVHQANHTISRNFRHRFIIHKPSFYSHEFIYVRFIQSVNHRLMQVPLPPNTLRHRQFWSRIFKVEEILKGSLDLIQPPSLSLKIQIMGGKDCLRSKGKTLLCIVNKLLKTKSLLTLTSPINVLPYYLR